MRANRWMWIAFGMFVASRLLLAAESHPARPEEPHGFRSSGRALLAIPDGPPRGRVKPPIRGPVSMGAYRFVGKGGEPVNTLEHVREKAGIFGAS
jgi:hypothetical protein